MHARKLLLCYWNPVAVVEGVAQDENSIVWLYRDQISGGRLILEHLRHSAMNEDEEHEMVQFLIVIWFSFRKINGMFLVIKGFEMLKPITQRFRFPSLQAFSVDFDYCISFCARRVWIVRSRNKRHLWAVNTTHQAPWRLPFCKSMNLGFNIPPDHNHHIIPYPFAQGHRRPPMPRSEAGWSSLPGNRRSDLCGRAC